VKDERTVATMDGTFVGQTHYVTDFQYGVRVVEHLVTKNSGWRADPEASPVARGWEAVLRYPYRERVPVIREEALRMRVSEPMTIGRYDVIFDAPAVAAMLRATLVPATEADRAMGYLANGAGTSFLTDPLDMIGTYQIASPLVSVSANRTLAAGCATVGWDDEGVAPADAPLITKGVLTDFQTTREAASWFAPYYAKRGIPVRSNGCAGTGEVTEPVTQASPNFVVAPGAQDATFLDLVHSVKTGIAIVGGAVQADFQGLTGLGRGVLTYAVADGALGAVLQGGAWNFRAPEFWKSVAAVGGPNSVASYGFASVRGGGYHTVAAVPMVVRNVPFVIPGSGA